MFMRLTAALLLLLPAAAHAGVPEAKICAASLDVNAAMIFNATLPSVKPGADLRALVTATTKQLVMSGKLARADAKPAAMAAGACLKLAL